MSYVRSESPYKWEVLKKQLDKELNNVYIKMLVKYINTFKTHKELVEFTLDLLGSYVGYVPYSKVYRRIKERNEIIDNLKKANGYDLWYLLRNE